MDLLNRAMQRAAELRSMAPLRARMAAAALSGVLLVCALWLLFAPSAGPVVCLLGGHAFSTSELPAVQAAFAKAGLSDFEVSGGQIRIPRGKQAQYLAALADGHALPSSLADRLVEIVKAQSPFASRAQQEQMQRAVVQSMIAQSIARMSGIESAELFLDTQPRRGFRQEALSTASVHVKTAGAVPLTPDKVRAIRGLVAGAVAGMAPEQVTVIDSTGQHWSGRDAVGSVGLDDPYLARKLAYEEGYAQKILASLAYVPGATVSVNVELSTQRRRIGSRQSVEPKTTAPITVPRAALVAGNVAPAAYDDAQQPNVAAALDAPRAGPLAAMPIDATDPLASQRATGSRGTTIDTEEFEIVGLTPQRVTVSVVVPVTYFEDIWRRRNAITGHTPLRSPTPAEMAPIETLERARIQETVLAQIPHVDGATAMELVSVTAFTPVPPAQQVTNWPVRIRNWLGVNWLALAVIVLPLGALCYLWKLGRVGTGPAAGMTQPGVAQHLTSELESSAGDAPPDEVLITTDGYRYGLDEEAVDSQHRGAVASRLSNSTHWTDDRAADARQASRGHGPCQFDLLNDASGRDIADLLAGEQPQTIAVVVGHLVPERAAEVVDCLPASLQADVMRRVVQLVATPRELLQEIESALVARLAQLGLKSSQQSEGWNAAQRILAAGGPDFAARLARRLSSHDQQLAAQLDSAPMRPSVGTSVNVSAAADQMARHELSWAFEELDRLSDADLRYVAAAANRDLLELALAGATPEFAERILRSMSAEQSRVLRQRLNQLVPTRISDIEQAQRELARLAFELLASSNDSATTGTRLVA
ncbi:MAG: hypothetical protein K2Y37_25465 [Pirellulales bacterium]|nr:hypothetical protein [Pirellulales bacterium]